MTGPEHYREAERLLQSAAEMDAGTDIERYALGAAQVHATLALAAASVIGTLHSPAQFRAWREAIGDKGAADGQ